MLLPTAAGLAGCDRAGNGNPQSATAFTGPSAPPPAGGNIERGEKVYSNAVGEDVLQRLVNSRAEEFAHAGTDADYTVTQGRVDPAEHDFVVDTNSGHVVPSR